MTQTTLAEALGVDQTTVAHIERGTRQPSSELLDALVAVLRLPAKFFHQNPAPPLSQGTLLFRAKSGVGKRTINRARAQAQIVFEMALKLADKATTIPVRLPRASDPIEAAGVIRRLTGAGDGPFPHLMRATERLGVLIVPLPDCDLCDAFAVWAGTNSDIPVIGFVPGKAPDRSRMNIAHELGHLILHRAVIGTSATMEREAYQFAAELLLPARSITPDLNTEKLTLFRLAVLKKKWHVSIQAAARRARELQFISDRQYRYLMQQLSRHGWRTAEPNFGRLEVERPRALRKMVEVIYGDNPNWGDIGRELSLPADFLQEITEAYAPAPGAPSEVPSGSSDAADVIPFKRNIQS